MLMGVREYARHRDVTQAAVQDAIRSGKISEAIVLKGQRKKIDQEKADKLWTDRTSVNNSNAHTNPSQLGQSLHKAKVAKETYAAKLAQLAFDQKSGKLCRVADVKKAAWEIGRVTSDKLMSIPDKLAPVFAAENDLEVIREMLSKALHEALNSIADPNFNFLQETQED